MELVPLGEGAGQLSLSAVQGHNEKIALCNSEEDSQQNPTTLAPGS